MPTRKKINFIEYMSNELKKVETGKGFDFILHIKVGKRETSERIEMYHKKPFNVYTIGRAISVVAKVIKHVIEYQMLPYKTNKICLRVSKR